jgi:serine/threonine protein kinase
MPTEQNSYIGKQIGGDYRIIAELNSGSFGSVYRARHMIFEDDPIVAIKLLHSNLHSSQEREQFIQEARLLRKLRHPYILPVIGAGFQDSTPYLITEYASSGSLRDRLNKQHGQPLSIEEALTILTQIGEALHHAHQQNIVHRDLKPENILFNAQGEALLADFGIAAILTTAKTRQIDVGGTPSYMAPEQFEGTLSMKSDQYALGCIAYELLTGQKPFVLPNPTLEAMWFQHSKVYPVAPTQLNPLIPTHVEQAIFKAIIKQRTDRHADIAAFITALQKTAKQWFDEGLALGKLNRYEEALVAYEQAIRLNPNDAGAYYYKGVALGELKRYEEELVAYEHALRLNPNYANTYYNKGVALGELKRYEEALLAFEQALRLNPNDTNAYFGKGVALERLKRYEEALLAFEQALRLNPNYADTYYAKSIVLRKLGRKKEAQQAYAKAKQLGL